MMIQGRTWKKRKKEKRRKQHHSGIVVNE